LLPEIVKDIEECSFLSFDGEFTGLSTERNIYPFDTSQEYYEKQVQTSSGFILIQLGVTFFKVQEETDDAGFPKISAKAYNIYVYPQPNNATFSCQGQSLTFLANNGFDFAKLFTQGISYSTEVEEAKIRKEVQEKQAFRQEQLAQQANAEPIDLSGRNYIPVPENEISMISDARERIKSVVDGKLKEVQFENKINPFQRKLIYELIEREFSNQVSTLSRSVDGGRKVMVVEQKRTQEEDQRIEESRQKDDEAYVIERVGLRMIMKEISKSKKLIVGHNCLLDFLYVIKQCFEDLPKDYEEFKLLTHRIFPNIIDTKFIGHSDKFKEMFTSTVLNQVCQRVREPPFSSVTVEWENLYNKYCLDNPKEHEAGFDSFMTGYCFLPILKYLKVPLTNNFEAAKCKELIPFLNRIALRRIQTPFIYITGKEPTMSRTHVFYLTFPSTWQTSDIQDIFKNYGPVQISWDGSTNAFVSLYNKENASCVLKTINQPAGFNVQSLADFLNSRKRRKLSSESGSDVTPIKEAPLAKPQKKKVKKTFAETDIW